MKYGRGAITLTDLYDAQEMYYEQDTEPSDASVGSTWYNTSDGKIRILTTDGSGGTVWSIMGSEGSSSGDAVEDPEAETGDDTIDPSFMGDEDGILEFNDLYPIYEQETGQNDWAAIKVTAYNMEGQFINTRVNGDLMELKRVVEDTNEIVKIASGKNHSVVLLDDGSIKVAGDNSVGQLGLGHNDNTSLWSKSEIGNIVDIAAGDNSSFACNEDGELWVTGSGAGYGLGTGNEDNLNLWTKITDIAGCLKVASSGVSTYVIRTDGTMKVVGLNAYGQLGDGTTNDQEFWEDGPSGVKTVTAGKDVVWFLYETGAAKFAGKNGYGQLGTGDTVNVTTVTDCDEGEIRSISMGDYHTLLLKTDGTIFFSGRNVRGQLATGDNDDILTFTKHATVTGAVEATCGANFSVVLTEDAEIKRHIFTVGENTNGQLGNGTTDHSNTFGEVTHGASESCERVRAGKYHLLTESDGGVCKASGKNTLGQLGNGTDTDTSIFVDTNMYFIKKVIRTGGYSSRSQFILLNNGDLKFTGEKLENIPFFDSNHPYYTWAWKTVMKNVKDFAFFQNAYYNMIILLNNGTVLTGGNNDYYQLGTGDTTNNYDTWTLTTGLPDGIERVYSGYYTFFATKGDTYYYIGQGSYYKLGSGSTDTVSSWTAETISSGNNIVDIQVGYKGAWALLSNGKAYHWGESSAGEGYQTTDHTSPTERFSDVKKISFSYRTAGILFNDGKLYTMGYNGYGQIGDSTSDDETEYYQVWSNSDDPVVDVVNGYYMTHFILESGKVRAMGYNNNGGLGDGTDTQQKDDVECNMGGAKKLWLVSNANAMIEDINGDLWMTGSHHKGVMGRQIQRSAEYTSLNFHRFGGDEPERITDFSKASNHALYLINDGTCRIAGSGSGYCLGTGTEDDITPSETLTTFNTPKFDNKIIKSIKSVHTNRSQGSILLKFDGTMLVSGNNDYGQLGISTGDKTRVTSWEVSPITDVNRVWLFNSHVVFDMFDGTIKMMGYNGDGVFGNGTTDNSTTEPVIISDIDGHDIVDFDGYSNEHCGFLTTIGDVYFTGKNDYGQLGDGTKDDSTSFVKANVSNVKRIECGYKSSGALGTDGRLKFVGQNYSGEFGLGDTDPRDYWTETNKDNIEDFAIGFRTSWLIDRATSEVFGAGQNSNGEIGDDTTDNKDFWSKQVNNQDASWPVTNLRGSYSSVACVDGRLKWRFNGNLTGTYGTDNQSTSKDFSCVSEQKSVLSNTYKAIFKSMYVPETTRALKFTSNNIINSMQVQLWISDTETV